MWEWTFSKRLLKHFVGDTNLHPIEGDSVERRAALHRGHVVPESSSGVVFKSNTIFFFFFCITLGLEMSDTKVWSGRRKLLHIGFTITFMNQLCGNFRCHFVRIRLKLNTRRDESGPLGAVHLSRQWPGGVSQLGFRVQERASAVLSEPLF